MSTAFKKEKYIEWNNFDLPAHIRKYEGEVILKALNDVSGRVTKAAALLGISHQSLSLILHQRHKNLRAHCVNRKTRARVSPAV